MVAAHTLFLASLVPVGGASGDYLPARVLHRRRAVRHGVGVGMASAINSAYFQTAGLLAALLIEDRGAGLRGLGWPEIPGRNGKGAPCSTC